MRNGPRLARALLCALAASSASAAPPVVTYLDPSGGRQGTTVEVTAGGMFDGWPVKVWSSGRGVTASAAKVKGKLTVAVAADAEPGVHFVRLYDGQGASALRPLVVGTVPEVAEREPNDEPKAAQPVDGPAVVNGRLAKNGDVDCFAVRLRKGHTLVAAVDANRTLRSPMDGVLQVLTPDGFVAAENHDHDGLDPLLAFAPPADGTYVVRLFAFPAVPDSSIRLAGGETFVYRLTLTTGGFADFPLPLAVARSGPIKSVAVVGWNIPDAAKSLLVRPGDGDTTTLAHPELANTARVRVEPHAAFDLASNSTPMTAPFTATVRVASPGGSAVVPVLAAKGQPLAVQVESRSLGLPLSPVVRVRDPDGGDVTRAEPVTVDGDAALTFTPVRDGAHRVEVRDRFGKGGPRFACLVRVTPPPAPGYALTVASDRLSVVPGKPLDVTVTVVRQKGFAGPVTVTAEGLPTGVKVEVVPPAGNPDPAAVVLRFAADGPSEGGPFRIVGRTPGRPTEAVTARTKPTDDGDTTADLWVTATATPPAATPPKKKK